MPGRYIPLSSRRSKYQPLSDFLAAHDEDTVRLTFAQIEALTGSPLPVSAYGSTSYWRSAPGASRMWAAVGWEAAQLDRRGRAVLFRRLTKE